MTDITFLSWPFFDDNHRSLARDLEKWAGRHIGHIDGDAYDMSRKLVALLGEGGWLNYAVPPAGDGAAGAAPDVRSLCIIRETLARHASLADFAFAMQGLGTVPISLFGSDEQRKTYLPPAARGASIAAFALSETDAGSDVGAIATTARKDGSNYILDGAKTWISNAGIADFYLVFARTGEAPGTKGLSAFVVSADTAGFDVSEQIDCISPHPLGSLTLANCTVPASQMVGSPGDGFKIAMATLDVFRPSVGAAALGFARRALQEATARARSRNVFNKPLAEFQMTKQKLAEMSVDVDASALLVYRAAWAKDSGALRTTREAAAAKMYATEAAQRVIDHAVQIFGGLGVVSGETVERLYRDIRPLRIYEGTTEIQKLVIAREILETSPGGK